MKFGGIHLATVLSLLAIVVAGGGGGCTSNGSSADKPTTKGKFPLTVKLEAKPEVITINKIPGPADPNKPQPKQVKLTLTVTNNMRSDYHGEWQDSKVARFWVTDELSVIWVDAPTALPAITKIDLAPGQSISYAAQWDIADARGLLGNTLTAHGIFLPEHLTGAQKIEVKRVD